MSYWDDIGSVNSQHDKAEEEVGCLHRKVSTHEHTDIKGAIKWVTACDVCGMEW